MVWSPDYWLRKLVYGIEDLDLPVHERVRWSFAAGAVVCSSILTSIGMAHFASLATDLQAAPAVAAGFTFTFVFLFDRAISRPRPMFDGQPTQEKNLAIRIALAVITVGLGGLGLGLLVTNSEIDATLRREIYEEQLTLMQDRSAAFFSAAIAERDDLIGRICALDGGFRNLQKLRPDAINRQSIGPAIKALAGSHALDTVVAGGEPNGTTREVLGSRAGCPDAANLISEDPFEPLWQRAKAGGGSVEAPSLEDVAAYAKSFAKERSAAQNDADERREALRKAAAGERFGARIKSEAADEHLYTFNRLSLFIDRWQRGIQERLDERNLSRKIAIALGDHWAMMLFCFLAVAVFDLTPLFIARYMRPADDEDSVERRLGRADDEANEFRNRSTSQRIKSFDDPQNESIPDFTDATNAELKIAARSFRGVDTVPKAARSAGIRTPPDPLPAPTPLLSRRWFIAGSAAAVGATGTLAAIERGSTIGALFTSAEGPTVGGELLAEFTKSFGLSVATSAFGLLSGFDPERVARVLMGRDVTAARLAPDYRPDSQPPASAWSTFGGGLVYGVGSSTDSIVYPGFAAPGIAARGVVTPENSLLLGPHWLQVIDACGSEMLTRPPLGGAEASAALFPVAWGGGRSGVPSVSQSGPLRVTASWKTLLGEVQVDLVATDLRRPSLPKTPRRVAITSHRAEGYASIVLADGAPAGLDTAQLLRLQRLMPDRVDLSDVRIPVLWD